MLGSDLRASSWRSSCVLRMCTEYHVCKMPRSVRVRLGENFAATHPLRPMRSAPILWMSAMGVRARRGTQTTPRRPPVCASRQGMCLIRTVGPTTTTPSAAACTTMIACGLTSLQSPHPRPPAPGAPRVCHVRSERKRAPTSQLPPPPNSSSLPPPFSTLFPYKSIHSYFATSPNLSPARAAR